MRILALTTVLALSAVAFGQTATLYLESPEAGTTVTPGTMINWTFSVELSSGDNDGLALVAADLVQDGGNPEALDIPMGSEASIVAPMDQFSRSLGISNPGEGGASTGYVGVQRGTAGAMNLIQMGGAQNTFGAAGSSIGTDANVEAGVALGSKQLVVSGSFAAPTTAGTYTFSLANGIANVLTVQDPDPTPPAFWPVVSAATVDIATNGSFSFTVGAGATGACCDFLTYNCTDHDRWRPAPAPTRATARPVAHSRACASVTWTATAMSTFDDITPFVIAIGDDGTAWAAWYTGQFGSAPNCDFLNGDSDSDGDVDFDDITPFVDAIPTDCTSL
jgi:hypothetical protein